MEGLDFCDVRFLKWVFHSLVFWNYISSFDEHRLCILEFIPDLV